MQAQKVISLTEEQRNNTLKNWFKILELENVKEIVSEKHPSFSKEDIKRYNLKLITNFGDYYWVYKGIHKHTKKPYFFCIVEAKKFVVLNLRACSAYYHLFKDEIDKVSGYDFNARCQVFLCTTYTIAEGMKSHIAYDVFPCLYRFISLPEIYVLIGSKNPDSMYGLAYDYKINKDITPIHSNGLSYATIYDTDIIARMLNANEGDIISHRRLLWENGTAYSEIYNRCVKRTSSGLSNMLPDGKCFGHMVTEGSSVSQKEIDDKKEDETQDLVEKDSDLIDKDAEDAENPKEDEDDYSDSEELNYESGKDYDDTDDSTDEDDD